VHCDGDTRTDITGVPQVLLIKLNREYFVTVDNGMRREKRKDTHAVWFPESMVVNGAHLFLTGVVVHSGRSMDEGHYTAYVRPNGRQWLLMNDGHKPQEVNINVPREKSACMLFYSGRE
jgi:ubiquitin C-terminal hydrolase